MKQVRREHWLAENKRYPADAICIDKIQWTSRKRVFQHDGEFYISCTRENRASRDTCNYYKRPSLPDQLARIKN